MHEFYTEIIIISFCLAVSFLFAGGETAFFSLKKADLHRFANSSSKRERSISYLMRNPQKVLITILSVNLFANLALSSVTTSMLLVWLGEWGHYFTILIVAPLVIIFLEITPKLLAVNQNLNFSRKIVPVIQFFHLLLYPVRVVMVWISDMFIKAFSLNLNGEKMTEDELDHAVQMAEQSGAIDPEEGQFIKNVIKFPGKEASAVMFPRNSATFIPAGTTIEEAMNIFSEKGIIRAPVYKDNPDNIVGMIDSRRLIPYYLKYKKAKNIDKFISSIRFFPETRDLNELLNDFLNDRIQIAILVDEYGGTAGVVTLNAILSELMGKDFTRWESEYKPDIKKKGYNYSLISGEMRIDDFNEFFEEDLDSENSETMGGYAMEKLTHIPKRGETLTTEKHILRIKYIKKNKIESIEVIPLDGGV